MALTNKLSAIGDAIREKTNTNALLTLDAMPAMIRGIETGSGGIELPAEAFNITGYCDYYFVNGNWDWFINTFGKRVTTNDIASACSMFSGCQDVTSIPFEINFKGDQECDVQNMFSYCNNLTSLPKINNLNMPWHTGYMLAFCYRLREIPEHFVNSINWNYTIGVNDLFNQCYSLRSIPKGILTNVRRDLDCWYSFYSGAFYNCRCLDELKDLPVFNECDWYDNIFNDSFYGCQRLKEIVFEMNEDGTPKTANWTNQNINLTENLGYCYNEYEIIQWNSGITADKEVKDDTTYQALKNDPDWFTKNIEYSRYNKESAVNTINSLPDTSAFGSNMISFMGNMGSLTDGGAINTLTEEEIAVAAARGWTVSFV